MSFVEPAPVGVRAQTKQRTRDEIVNAAMNLFLSRGFDNVTTQEIAEAAGVTQRTVFRYFARKDLILYDQDDNYVRRFEILLDEAMLIWPEPYDAVKSAFTSLTQYYDENRLRIFSIYRIVQNSDQMKLIDRGKQIHIDYLVACAFDGVQAYQARKAEPSLSSRLLAGVLFGAIRPIQRAWLEGELKGELRLHSEVGWAHLRPIYEAAKAFGDATAAGFARLQPD